MAIKQPNEYEEKDIVKKYRLYLTHPKGKGGIFTTITRGNLLGVPIKGRKKRDKNYDFWLDVRSQVKTALVDLNLFIETAGEKNVNQVLTPEALEPVVESLLWHPILRKDKPDLTRANIAKLFIHEGFRYLRSMQKKHTTGLYSRAIDDAYEACKYLVELFRSQDETGYVSPVERWETPKS